jgi:hypothetical protein
MFSLKYRNIILSDNSQQYYIQIVSCDSRQDISSRYSDTVSQGPHILVRCVGVNIKFCAHTIPEMFFQPHSDTCHI